MTYAAGELSRSGAVTAIRIMDARVTEFHFITPLENIPTVLTHGILSHDRATRIGHLSVASAAVQQHRAAKQVKRGLRLHQYGNLYFHARNPMMSALRDQAETLCAMRISKMVLATNGVVLADCNASSDYVRFLAPSQSWELSFDDIYARNWKHPDDYPTELRHKSRKCAEVLVPSCVPTDLLLGAYVLNGKVKSRLQALGFPLAITIDPDLFFR